MKLKKVELTNIRSYEQEKIDFPEGNLLFSGDIGAGKSSVLLAIEFALFGLQRGKSGSQLLRNGTKEGSVRLNFEIDGKEIDIERTIKRAKEGVQQEKCILQVSGKKEELSSTEIKNRILALLNYPQEFMTKNPILYRFTVYTPQEEMKTILLEEGEIRLNVLRRVFGIDKYKRIIENTERITTKIREEINLKEGRVMDLAEKKNVFELKKDELKKAKGETIGLKLKHEDIKKIVDERKRNNEEFENKIKEANKLKTDHARKESELNEKQRAFKRNAIDVEETKKRIILLENDLNGKKEIDESSVLTEIKTKESQIKILENEFIQLTKKITIFESEKSRNLKLTSSINSIELCPTCQQNVSLEHKCAIKTKADEEISNIESNLQKESKEKEKIVKNLEQMKNELIGLRNSDRENAVIKFKLNNLKEAKEREKKLLETLNADESLIKEIEKEVKKISDGLTEFQDCEKNFLMSKRMLDEAKEDERKIEIEKARFEKQMEDCEVLISLLEKEIKEKEKTKEEMRNLKEIKEWLSEQFISAVGEIEKNVMLKVHSEFSTLFGKWFAILAEGLSARVDEEFSPIIEQNGYEIEYAYLSGGERTAAALAYRLTLNQIINSMISEIKTRDLLILDEPTDGFSSEQLDKMREVLKELKTKQIILVSHEQKIEPFVDKIIRFEKINGITKINLP